MPKRPPEDHSKFVEELKFAFVNEALLEGKPLQWAVMAGDVALADEFEHAQKLCVKLMACDIGIICRSFVGEGATLLQRYNKKQYRGSYLQRVAEYLETNYLLHFADMEQVIRMRWMASLMIALSSRNYEALRRDYAKHFDIDPANPTAPYAVPEGQPHALRDKIVTVLALAPRKAG